MTEPDDVHLLTGAYALDALDTPEERERFEAHLDGCDSCREEVRSLRETVAALTVEVAVPPPASLTRRVFEQLPLVAQEQPGTSDTDPDADAVPAPIDAPVPAQVPAPVPVPVPLPRRSSGTSAGRRRSVAVALVAAAVVGVVGVSATTFEQGRQAQARAERLLAIVADPAARRQSVDVSGGRATLVAASGGSVLVAAGLPALDTSRTYQVWLLRDGQARSAGLGGAGATAAQPWQVLVDARPGDSVAISVEPRAGSQQPTTTPVAVLAA